MKETAITTATKWYEANHFARKKRNNAYGKPQKTIAINENIILK